jgi:hypothetical protein
LQNGYNCNGDVVGETNGGEIGMRVLKIVVPIKNTFDIDVPNVYFSIKSIALKYAKTKEELCALYDAGLEGYELAKVRLDKNKLSKFGMWWVQQEILKYKLELEKL